MIIMDTSSHDNQSISRVYRLGQKKTCFIYRLVSKGTMEEEIYLKPVAKEAKSLSVVNRTRMDDLRRLSEHDPTTRPTPIMPADDVLKQVLEKFPSLPIF